MGDIGHSKTVILVEDTGHSRTVIRVEVTGHNRGTVTHVGDTRHSRGYDTCEGYRTRQDCDV